MCLGSTRIGEGTARECGEKKKNVGQALWQSAAIWRMDIRWRKRTMKATPGQVFIYLLT